MSLVRTFYDPFAEFDKLFDDAFNVRFHHDCSPPIEGNTALIHRRDRGSPGKMDLHENAQTKRVTATFELPGVRQDEVNVEVHGNRLTISGESKRSENYNYVVEDVHAKMENGVLTVCFPKAGPDEQPQRIAIA
ncbi:hypothetical protein BDR07DRAFT_1390970 [Suillus spraguei]|nr:hypothetical protein BDR07DRAFT_1390970 [Suillus spraguei]